VKKEKLKNKNLHILLSIFLIVAFLGTLFPADLWAQQRAGEVTGSIVNVRKGPDTSYSVVAKVKKGETVTILAEENDWFQVKLTDGKTGWIANYLVKPGEIVGTQVGTINGTSVNVRQGAATTYPTLFKLQKGDQVTIKEQKNDWYLIDSPKGSGWVAAWLVTLPGQADVARKATVTGSVVNIRQGPGTNTALVTQVKKGETVEIIGQEQDWYKIRTTSGKEGWVANWLVSLNNDLETTPVNPGSGTGNNSGSTPAPGNNSGSGDSVSNPGSTSSVPQGTPISKKVIVTGNVVNTRSGPGLNYSVIGKVQAGTELQAVAQEGDWLKVQLPNGQFAWIAGWLTVDKDSKPLPQPESYINELKIVLDSERNLEFKNYGDKLNIFVSGVNQNGYQIKKIDDKKLRIEVKSGALNPSVKAINNWGVKEAKVSGQAIDITFDYKYEYTAGYNKELNGLEVNVSYPQEDLIPVRQIKFSPQENEAVVQIDTGKNIKYTTQQPSSNRLVIDLPNTSLQLKSKEEAEQNVAYGPIRKITSRQLSPELVRVEAEFAPGVQYQVTQQDGYIVLGAKMGASGGGGSLAGKTIVIDPGHGSIQPGGWTDPGAIGRVLGIYERDINLAVALKVRDLLTQHGANVVMTHSTGQTYLSLAGRADVANRINADIFVSIHCNSHTNPAISGTSVYYYAPTWHSQLSSQRWLRQRLATYIQNEVVKSAGRKNLGILEENFAVLRETTVPSVLVEMAYLSNPEEERLLATDSFRNQIAWGIFKGIEAYFKSL